MIRPNSSDNALNVCCAIIEHKGRVLAAQRGRTTANAGKWEFPGGKIEPGETPTQCIIREIMEELSIAIKITGTLDKVVHHYPDRLICLHPFICSHDGGEISVNEHEQVGWFLPEELWDLHWSDADIKVLENYQGLPDDAESP